MTEMLSELDALDRVERAQYLLELSDEFMEVPETIAVRPFPEDRRVPKCESEAFVWAQDQDDGTLKFHYAVENPLGISARAMGAILDETMSGQPMEQVANVSARYRAPHLRPSTLHGQGRGISRHGRVDHFRG